MRRGTILVSCIAGRFALGGMVFFFEFFDFILILVVKYEALSHELLLVILTPAKRNRQNLLVGFAYACRGPEFSLSVGSNTRAQIRAKMPRQRALQAKDLRNSLVFMARSLPTNHHQVGTAGVGRNVHTEASVLMLFLQIQV